jgi:hypothetical protein
LGVSRDTNWLTYLHRIDAFSSNHDVLWGLAVTGLFSPFHWLGFVISPRLVALILLFQNYWNTNPILCTISAIFWVIASIIKFKVTVIVSQIGAVAAFLGLLTGAGTILATIGERIDRKKRLRPRVIRKNFEKNDLYDSPHRKVTSPLNSRTTKLHEEKDDD